MSSLVFSQVGKKSFTFYRWGNCGGENSVRNMPKINSDIFLWWSEASSSDLLPPSGVLSPHHPPSFASLLDLGYWTTLQTQWHPTEGKTSTQGQQLDC